MATTKALVTAAVVVLLLAFLWYDVWRNPPEKE